MSYKINLLSQAAHDDKYRILKRNSTIAAAIALSVFISCIGSLIAINVNIIKRNEYINKQLGNARTTLTESQESENIYNAVSQKVRIIDFEIHNRIIYTDILKKIHSLTDYGGDISKISIGNDTTLLIQMHILSISSFKHLIDIINSDNFFNANTITLSQITRQSNGSYTFVLKRSK